MMTNNTETVSMAKRAADNIRVLVAAMVEKAKSGHPGGAMGGADFIHVLFSEFLRYDPSDMRWPFRDRFFMDPGHMSPMLYAIQALLGNYSLEDIANFRQWGSPTPGHPELDVDRGVENTSGPLGLGHTFGIGAAIAERFHAARFGEWTAHRTFIYISDGGIQEEISQGAGRTAGHLGLGNVIMFYDANDIQLSSRVEDVMGEDTAMKYQSWGWHVITIPGNDPDQIRHALQAGIDENDRPTLIIGKTTMGKGAVTAAGESFEGEVETHGQPLSKAGADTAKTIVGLGGDPDQPFVIFPDVAAHYAEVKAKKTAEAAKRKAAQVEWEKSQPELAAKLQQFFSPTPAQINWEDIPQKSDIASRNASAAVLSYLADHVENMIVSSADLSNSDKTQAWLNKTSIFRKGDFNGSFLQAGVSELTMAALCTGMALHGGVIPVCATFFVFSDYMKPAIRVAALMEQQVIFIWTHDAFRVGEDGPTHQPIEQEAQIRLLEQLQNHSHRNSFLALRPADAQETTVCWKLAFENKHSPSGLILSRQNIPDIPAASGNRYQEAANAEKGAYTVQDVDGQADVILVATGSEVSTLVAGAGILEQEDGLKIKIVSAPSEGLFRNQPTAYQQALLPTDVPTFGLTAGLPSALSGLVPYGKIWGLNHFGHSAPYKVLDEQFGFTGANIANQVRNYLAETKA